MSSNFFGLAACLQHYFSTVEGIKVYVGPVWSKRDPFERQPLPPIVSLALEAIHDRKCRSSEKVEYVHIIDCLQASDLQIINDCVHSPRGVNSPHLCQLSNVSNLFPRKRGW